MLEERAVPLDSVFYPDSIAIIGVSEREDNLAANIVRNLATFGYSGDVYAVGRRDGHVRDTPILASVDALPNGIDLAVILTPGTTVPGLVDACGRKGIRRAVIESGGFAEFSDAGSLLEKEVTAAARRWGIRFVGPNCISVFNTQNGLCLPFVLLDPDAIRQGPVSVLAQSGGISITYLILLSEAGLGANKVVSMGNKTDLDEIDYLSYLLDDPTTEIICLYLESISQGRRLLELAASSPKPIIVQKANRSRASAQIAFSHTAALANDDAIVDAALRQAGIARAFSFDGAVAVAQGFTLPPITGQDLLIISRSGGHAVVAADEAETHGFQLMSIDQTLTDTVRGMFRADVITPTNPLDLGAIFDFDLYSHIVEESLRTLNPDVLLLIHTYSSDAEAAMSQRMARRLEQVTRELETPVAVCAFAQHREVVALRQGTGLPIFTEIEAAFQAMAASRDRHTRPTRLLSVPARATRRSDKAEALLATEGVLTSDEALDLCSCFGIAVEEWSVVSNHETAALVAASVGYPVVLKGLSPDVSHKSDAGLVVLNVGNEEQLQAAFDKVWEALEEYGGPASTRGIMVQHMLSGGHELVIGGKRDPSFGPVVMLGLGGIRVEVLKDVVFRLAPLCREEARLMMSELRGSPLLHGIRGEPPADLDAIYHALLSMSDLLTSCPEIVEIDINPFVVFEEGAAAIDARAVVASQRA